MMAIPVPELNLVILVLEKENLIRIQDHDPIVIDLPVFHHPQPPPSKLRLLIAYEDDAEVVIKAGEDAGLPGIIRFLERNRTIYAGERVGTPTHYGIITEKGKP